MTGALIPSRVFMIVSQAGRLYTNFEILARAMFLTFWLERRMALTVILSAASINRVKTFLGKSVMDLQGNSKALKSSLLNMVPDHIPIHP